MHNPNEISWQLITSYNCIPYFCLFSCFFLPYLNFGCFICKLGYSLDSSWAAVLWCLTVERMKQKSCTDRSLAGVWLPALTCLSSFIGRSLLMHWALSFSCMSLCRSAGSFCGDWILVLILLGQYFTFLYRSDTHSSSWQVVICQAST